MWVQFLNIVPTMKDITPKFRIESESFNQFKDNSEKVNSNSSEVLRELIKRFNSDPRLRNSIRVSLEIKNKKA